MAHVQDGGIADLRHVRVHRVGRALLAPHDPLAADWSALRQPPRDIFLVRHGRYRPRHVSRVIWGSRASLLAGVVSVLIAIAAGVPLGCFRLLRWDLDMVLMRITDGLLAIRH